MISKETCLFLNVWNSLEASCSEANRIFYFVDFISGHFLSTQLLDEAGQPAGQTQWIKEGEITPSITIEEYISRRKRILELLPEKSLAIIVAALVKMMTDVVPNIYRQDANYSYITGYQQPDSVAVLGHDYGLCMFMPEGSPEVCSECFMLWLFLLLHAEFP
ncbi:hypothetical protein C3L33_19165, partial [Rhododendron williamsianum]